MLGPLERISLFLFCSCLPVIFAQVQVVGVFPGSKSPLPYISNARKIYSLPPIDNNQLVARELEKERKSLEMGIQKPYKFGEAIEFELDIHRDGEWSLHENGVARVWRAAIVSPGAQSISVSFSEFYLPPNGEFYVIGRNRTVGAFTGRLNNKPDKLFSIAPIDGDMAVLEYWEAIEVDHPDINELKQESDLVSIKVDKIIHGFRGMPGGSSAGPCNVDVACPDGNKYRDLINSVGLLITESGQSICSGTLLNNAKQDGRQLFLTAAHCVRSSRITTNYIVGFNFQRKNCGGTEIGGNFVRPEVNTVQGLKLLAKWVKSDFALFEIAEFIPDSYNVFYAGWTREKIAPKNVTCIHHPRGDVKKISRFTGQTRAPKGPSILPNNNYYWKVPNWTTGVTEPGSSGSGLFNHQGLLVGTLYGGSSSCNEIKGYDYFGGLAFHWDSGASADQQLAQFLDPGNKKVLFLEGNYYSASRKGPWKSPQNLSPNMKIKEATY